MSSRELSHLEEQGACCSPPEGPVPCINNCGFFGTPENNNLCSYCFKKALRPSINLSASSFSVKESSPSLLSVKEGSPTLCSLKEPSPSSTCAEPAPTVSSSSTCAEPDPRLSSSSTCVEPDPSLLTPLACAAAAAAPTPPQKPNRCFSCRKRLGLTGFKCRCGDVFCSLHRYSDKHDCSFDYKAAAREIIAKANPVVKADKIKKI